MQLSHLLSPSSRVPPRSTRLRLTPGAAAGSPPSLSLPNSSGTRENKTPPADRFIGNFPAGLAQTPRPRSIGAAARMLLGSCRGTVPARGDSPDATLQTWPCLSPAATCPGRCLHPTSASPAGASGAAQGRGAALNPRNVLVAARSELGAAQLASLRDTALTSISFTFGSSETTG